MKKWGWRWQIKISGISLTALCFLLSTIAISTLSKSAIAGEEKRSDSVVLFQPPPDDAQPESTEGAASRNGNQCPADSLSKADRFKLKAIVPQGNSGLTTKERPTFWAYIPPTTARSAILSLAKVGTQPHWQQAINLTGKPREIGVKLDPDADGLEIGQNYRWALILVCGERPHPNDPVVTAGIKRINHNKLPQNITKLEQATWYAERGIWYDALDILAREKSFLHNGEDLWSRYLRSGGFSIDN